MPMPKVIFVGDRKSGRTSIINRYTHDTYRDPPSPAPNHFAIKIIDMADGSDVHLRLFDADDDAPFFRVRNSYERTDGAGAFVVFDCSQPNEFETHVAKLKCRLESNIELSRVEFDRKESEARKHFPEILQMEENIARFERDLDKRRKDFPVILLVSKCDIEHPAILEDRELLAVCKRCGFAGFFEVSAKDPQHEGISLALSCMTNLLLEQPSWSPKFKDHSPFRMSPFYGLVRSSMRHLATSINRTSPTHRLPHYAGPIALCRSYLPQMTSLPRFSVRPFASFIGHKAKMMTLAPAQQHLLLCSSGHTSHFINAMLPRFREERQRQLLDESKHRRDPRVELLMRLFSSATAERLEGVSRSAFKLPADVSVEDHCELQVAPWQLGYDLERCPGSSCGRRYSIFNRQHTCRCCGLVMCGSCMPIDLKAVWELWHTNRLCAQCLRGLSAKKLVEEGKLDAASPLLAEILQGFRTTLGETHIFTLQSMNRLGVVMRLQGRYEEGRELLEKALEGCKRSLHHSHVFVLQSKFDLALLMHEENELAQGERHQKAKALLHECFEGAHHMLAPDHSLAIECQKLLSSFYSGKKDVTELMPFPYIQ